MALSVGGCNSETGTKGGASAPTSAPVASSTITVPTRSPTATPTPPPFPEVHAVKRSGGRGRHTSRHWVGYTFPTGDVTGVRAEWTEPTVSPRPGAEEFTWIGVGGWGSTVSNIVQIGTFAYFPTQGSRHQGVWYQRVPTEKRANYPLVGVDPGDHVYASVALKAGGGDKWKLSLDDVTNGNTFTTVLPFHSKGAYPSIVVEDPNTGTPGPTGPFYPFPRWRSVHFENVQVRVHGAWVASASLYADRIDMVRHGEVLATASPLTVQSEFSVTQQ
jgi:hypothetical protein